MAQVVGTLFQTGLRGEGNLLHRLKAYHYRLGHQQSPVHELDFGVASLAGDLRDGLRLCKLVEKLTGADGPHAWKLVYGHFPGSSWSGADALLIDRGRCARVPAAEFSLSRVFIVAEMRRRLALCQRHGSPDACAARRRKCGHLGTCKAAAGHGQSCGFHSQRQGRPGPPVSRRTRPHGAGLCSLQAIIRTTSVVNACKLLAHPHALSPI